MNILLYTLLVTSFDAHSGVEYTWFQTMSKAECVSEVKRLRADPDVSNAVCLPSRVGEKSEQVR